MDWSVSTTEVRWQCDLLASEDDASYALCSRLVSIPGFQSRLEFEVQTLYARYFDASFNLVRAKRECMTNFDPGGLLLLLTVIPAVAAGLVSITLAHVAAWVGYEEYETSVVVLLAVLISAWIVAAFLVSTSLLQILAVVLAMIGAFAVTRSITASSYGWVLGVVLLFVTFIVLSTVGVYRGVDQTGRPQGSIARHVDMFYYGGLLIYGAIGGKVVETIQYRWL